MMGACLKATRLGTCLDYTGKSLEQNIPGVRPEKERSQTMKKRYILAIAVLIAVKAAVDMLFETWIEGMNETWRMMGE